LKRSIGPFLVADKENKVFVKMPGGLFQVADENSRERVFFKMSGRHF